MKNYVVEIMTREDYHKYMMGSNESIVKKVVVVAKNEPEAIKEAEKRFDENEYHINRKYIKTEEELKEIVEQRIREHNEFLRKEEERKAEAKAKRERNELEKANALGLTVAEYRQKVNKERQIKKLENEIANLKKALYYKEKALANLK